MSEFDEPSALPELKKEEWRWPIGYVYQFGANTGRLFYCYVVDEHSDETRQFATRYSHWLGQGTVGFVFAVLFPLFVAGISRLVPFDETAIPYLMGLHGIGLVVAGSIFLGLGQIVDAPGIGEIAKPKLVASAHLGVLLLAQGSVMQGSTQISVSDLRFEEDQYFMEFAGIPNETANTMASVVDVVGSLTLVPLLVIIGYWSLKIHVSQSTEDEEHSTEK